jgi:hypothetical protein
VARACDVVGRTATVTHSASARSACLESRARAVNQGPRRSTGWRLTSGPAPRAPSPSATCRTTPMLAWAGPRVAVANAHPRSRPSPTRSPRSNDDDGVALVVERLLAASALAVACRAPRGRDHPPAAGRLASRAGGAAAGGAPVPPSSATAVGASGRRISGLGRRGKYPDRRARR